MSNHDQKVRQQLMASGSLHGVGMIAKPCKKDSQAAAVLARRRAAVALKTAKAMAILNAAVAR